jgi:CBS domain-containing protein
MDERTVFQSISKKHVVTVPPHASIREAACVMTRANCGSVLVMEPPNVLLGILTERDLMTRVLARSMDPERSTAREVMTPKPVCVAPEFLVSDALVIMLERGFRHLPIIDAHGRILGVFSLRDALPLEIGTALDIAAFNEQVNDALG